MRKFATTGALCAIVLSTSLATAKDDFGALLSQLSYGKPTASAASVPSYKVASNAAVQGGAAPVAASQNTGTSQAFSMPAASHQQVVMAASQQYAGPAPVSYQPACDVAQGGCNTGGCASGDCGSGSCRDGSCGEGGFCTPHNQPNLPGSTLRQYWRSNSCNANVWDGYQNKCRKPLFGGKSRRCGLGGDCGNGVCGNGDCADGSCGVAMPSQAACDTQQYAVPSSTAQPAAGCDSGSCDSGSCDSGACDTNVWSM